MNNDQHNLNANRDPLTGAPGSHPVGTGLGAIAGGAAAGAATGTVAGPIGTVVWPALRRGCRRTGRHGRARGQRPHA
jgi:hypothetical protein